MQRLLKELKSLNLPLDEYAVFGSGPLQVHGIREAKDLDLIVTKNLWKDLSKKNMKLLIKKVLSVLKFGMIGARTLIIMN